MTTTTEHILELVQEALDGLDDRPLEATARKMIRIASLLGDSRLAVRLGLEIKPNSGSPAANAEDVRKLLANPDTWGDPEGDAEAALAEYLADRSFDHIPGLPAELQGKVLRHSISEIPFWDAELRERLPDDPSVLPMRILSTQTLIRVRHRCFVSLCRWERQLTYADTNERIFRRFQDQVDALLSAGAPDLLGQFNAVYRRLRDGARSGPTDDAEEELAQALVTCRRILEAVVDQVHPRDVPATLQDGTLANPDQYRARLSTFLRSTVHSDTYRDAVDAETAGLYGRFEAADKLASKGVHADVALEEAEACALATYILAGQILQLRFGRADPEPPGPEHTFAPT
jgi:hypothetical protein